MIWRICRVSGCICLIGALLIAFPTGGQAGGASGSPGASAFGTNPMLGARAAQLRIEIARAEAERARWGKIDDALAKVTLALLGVKATAEAITALGFTFVSLIDPVAAPLAARQVDALARTLATLMDELDK